MSALSGSSRFLAVYKKSVVEQGVFHEFASTTRRLKDSTNFESVENVRSSKIVKFEFELRRILVDAWKDSSPKYVLRELELLTHLLYWSGSSFWSAIGSPG